MTLTAKQDAFALHYFEHGNAAEAYRQAYDVAENARDSWVYVEACQLLDNPKITLRLKELKEQAQELAIFNRHQALDELEDARKLAMKIGAPAAAVSAVNGKVKLFGLEPKKPARVEHTGAGGGPIRTIDESKSEAELIEQAQKLGIDPTALGLAGSEEEGN